MDTIRNWYEMTLAQMVSDSYLDNINIGVRTKGLEDRLRDGANHYDPAKRARYLASNNLSATRMTKTMIDDFFKTWEIIDHKANTSSGFSATLMKHKKTGEFTLSFRSTESKQSIDGGDVERDSGNGANGQIADLGFAYAQLLDMEDYYQQLKDQGHIPADTGINITGYSLGGHLAQVFTRLHYNEIIHTYTINGAGFGDFAGASTGEDYKQAVTDRLNKLQAVIADPADYLDDVSFTEFVDLGYTNIVSKKINLDDLLLDRQQFIDANPDGYTNIYNDPLFQYAIKTLPDSDTGAKTISILELLPDVFEIGRERISKDNKITNLFGHAVPADDAPLTGC